MTREEAKSNKELLCDSCYRKIAGCQAKFHNPHPVDHCIEYKPIEKQADGEYISRTAIKYINAPIAPIIQGEEVHYEWVAFRNQIEQLPSVAIPSAEPKTGHWIYIGNGHNGLHKCSECGEKRKMFDGLEKYCVSCGARMVEPQERSEE